jgi:hypothetical protein
VISERHKLNYFTPPRSKECAFERIGRRVGHLLMCLYVAVVAVMLVGTVALVFAAWLFG